MNQISQPSKPATSAEISEAVKLLFESGLPFQRGANPGNVAMAYVESLRGMSAPAITAGILKFLRGECEEVSPRYVPTPPELARIVRTAVVPERIPAERRIAPPQLSDAERARMRLKMPMFDHAWRTSQMDRLDRANREGFAAMVMLAQEWGIQIPDELNDRSIEENERLWREARNRAWREIERSPPPFMRRRKAAGDDDFSRAA